MSGRDAARGLLRRGANNSVVEVGVGFKEKTEDSIGPAAKEDGIVIMTKNVLVHQKQA